MTRIPLHPSFVRPLLVMTVAALSAWQGKVGFTGPIGSANGRTIYGIDGNSSLITFGAIRPDVVMRRVTVAGLQSGESLQGIDFGAVDAQLYALGSTSRMYTLDRLTGAATMVGTTV